MKSIRFKYCYNTSLAGEVIDKNWWGSGEELLYTCQDTPMLSEYPSFPFFKRTKSNSLLLTRNATPYIFIPKINSIFSNVVQRVDIKTNENDVRFLRYSLQDAVNGKHVNGDIIPSWNMNIWDNLNIPLYTIEEQIKIANKIGNYIDQIDKIINIEKDIVKKTKLYLDSLINEIMSYGMESEELIETDNKWYHSIPKSWILTKVLYVLSMKITDGPHETLQLIDNGIPFISAEAIKNDRIDFSLKRGDISQNDYRKCCMKYIPRRGDLYIIKSGATTGNCALVNTDRIFTIWSPLAVLRPNTKLILPKYLFYLSKTNTFKTQIESNWSYGTQQNLSMRVLEKLFVLYPSLKTQEKIISFLDNKYAICNEIIKSENIKIRKLENLKTSYIHEQLANKGE